MKKNNIMLLIGAFCFQLAAFAQVPSKEQLFKTEVYWNQLYIEKEKSAPKEVQDKLNAYRQTAKQQKWTFDVGYTTVLDKDIKSITGFVMPEDLKKNPEKILPPKENQSMPAQPTTTAFSCSPTQRHFDLRDFGFVTMAKNQGSCGSCWAFSTVAVFESSYLKINGGDPATLDLSEQQVLDCSGWLSGCGGGIHLVSMQYLCTNSLQTETSYNYLAMGATCRTGLPATPYRARRWVTISNVLGSSTNEQIKQAICEQGSVSATMFATPLFIAYSSGVFNEFNHFAFPNHVIQIIGWDDDLNAWLIKNSWGERWGTAGFGWVAYGHNAIGGYASYVEANLSPR